MNFTDIFIRRPVLASVISLLILVLGVRAYYALPVLQYPRTENAVVTVTTTYYGADPDVELSRVFEDVQGYDDIVMLRDIEVESHCEHHMAPFLGKAHVAYMPTGRVVGLSKLARLVETAWDVHADCSSFLPGLLRLCLPVGAESFFAE